MSDTSERVGAVDGDALIEFLTTVTAMSHEAWQEIYDEITSGRFALKPEASQETKWDKLKTFLHETEKARGWSEKDYHSALFEVAKKMMELEAQQ